MWCSCDKDRDISQLTKDDKRVIVQTLVCFAAAASSLVLHIHYIFIILAALGA